MSNSHGKRVHAPCLEPEAVERALEAMRAGRPLANNSPLVQLLCIHPPHVQPLMGDMGAVQVRIYTFLEKLIIEQLRYHRAVMNVPTTGSYQEQLRHDFKAQNDELQAWSILHHRYVQIALDLSLKRMEGIVSHDERTLYRRQKLGFFRLTMLLRGQEAAARAVQWEAVLRQALPAGEPPIFIGREQEIEWALNNLRDEAIRHVLFTGETGIGKTALALKTAHLLIRSLPIENVAWINKPEPVPSRLYEQIAQALGLALAADNRTTLRTYLGVAPCLIVIDDADAIVSSSLHLEDVLNVLNNARLILCSRVWPSRLPIAPTLGLRELTREAFEYLIEKYADAYPQFLQRLDDLSAFYDRAGGNPGALRHALSPGDSSLVTLGNGMAQTWQRLAPQSHLVWLVLALLGEQPIRQARLRWALNSPDLQQDLSSLWQHHLIHFETLDDEVYVALTPLARAFAEAVLLDAADSHKSIIHQCLRRLADHLVEQPDSMACMRVLKAAENAALYPSLRLDLAYAFATIVERTGQWEAWASYLLTVAEAAEGRDRVWVWLHLGAAYSRLLRSDEAAYYLTEAIEMAGARGEFEYQASAQIALATLFRNHRTFSAAEFLLDEAERYFQRQQHLDQLERIHVERIQITLDQGLAPTPDAWPELLAAMSPLMRYALVQITFKRGEFDTALALAEGLYAHLLPDDPNYPRLVALIGQIHYERGEWPEAAEKMLWAIRALSDRQDMEAANRVKFNLALMYLREHNPAAALRLLP